MKLRGNYLRGDLWAGKKKEVIDHTKGYVRMLMGWG